MLKRFASLLSLLLLLLLALPLPALAQGGTPTLELKLSRDFGYGGFDNRIQGAFSFHAQGPDDLQRVEFYIDDQLVATVDAPPFETKFNTDSYAPGEHRLYALGYTASGQSLESNDFTRVFMTPAEARGTLTQILVPLLVVILIGVLLSAVVPRFFFRGRRAQVVGQYGLAGGAVCKRCGLPFSRHFLSPHLFTGKLERCPHCGKWAFVSRATPEQLAAAEARLAGDDAAQAAAPAETEEDRLRRQIEESRYD